MTAELFEPDIVFHANPLCWSALRTNVIPAGVILPRLTARDEWVAHGSDSVPPLASQAEWSEKTAATRFSACKEKKNSFLLGNDTALV